MFPGGQRPPLQMRLSVAAGADRRKSLLHRTFNKRCMIVRLRPYHSLNTPHEIIHTGNLQSIINLLSSFFVHYNAGLLQNGEMLGDCRKIGINLINKFTDALLPIRKVLNHPQPRRMSQRLQYLCLCLKQGFFFTGHNQTPSLIWIFGNITKYCQNVKSANAEIFLKRRWNKMLNDSLA